MSSDSKPRVRQNRHKQGLNHTREKLSADFRQKKMENKELQDTTRVDQLFERISTLIEQARQHVRTTVNLTEVYTKYNIGQYIIENEQQGHYRAQYGKRVLKELSTRLTERFGDGWSYETLACCRKFFIVYSNSVTSGYKIRNKKDSQRLPHSDIVTNGYKFDSHQPSNPQFTLSGCCEKFM